MGGHPTLGEDCGQALSLIMADDVDTWARMNTGWVEEKTRVEALIGAERYRKILGVIRRRRLITQGARVHDTRCKTLSKSNAHPLEVDTLSHTDRIPTTQDETRIGLDPHMPSLGSRSSILSGFYYPGARNLHPECQCVLFFEMLG